jgi:hypothetical protein
VAGISRFSSRAASIPFITGMARSSKIKSGCSCRALSTPSCPFSASPQTSQPLCCSSTSRKQRRTSGLSSTINMNFTHARFPADRFHILRMTGSSRNQVSTVRHRTIVCSIQYIMPAEVAGADSGIVAFRLMLQHEERPSCAETVPMGGWARNLRAGLARRKFRGMRVRPSFRPNCEFLFRGSPVPSYAAIAEAATSTATNSR